MYRNLTQIAAARAHAEAQLRHELHSPAVYPARLKFWQEHAVNLAALSAGFTIKRLAVVDCARWYVDAGKV